MITLRIEHPVSDLTVWQAAFRRFADARRNAGVRAERMYRPSGELNYVLVDLEFETVPAAHFFLDFLNTKVWSSPTNSPALTGTPETRILEPIHAGTLGATGPCSSPDDEPLRTRRNSSPS